MQSVLYIGNNPSGAQIHTTTIYTPWQGVWVDRLPKVWWRPSHTRAPTFYNDHT